MYRLETERLVLRPFTADDFEFICALNADPDVARFVGTGNPRTATESKTWLQTTLTWYARMQAGHLGVVLKHSGKLIGRCGLSPIDVEVPEAQRGEGPLRCFWGLGAVPLDIRTRTIMELGYVINKQHWGQGYATEAAHTVRDYAFDVLREPRLMSLIAPDNTASIRVAEKIGLRFLDRVDVFGHVAARFDLPRFSESDPDA